MGVPIDSAQNYNLAVIVFMFSLDQLKSNQWLIADLLAIIKASSVKLNRTIAAVLVIYICN